jgi:ribA/ribD-fused uncharacterized protein
MKIDSFKDNYKFLSNFAFCPNGVLFEGLVYSTAEHAYQASKTLDPDEKAYVRFCETPGKAKRAGRNITLREDWELVKIENMREIVLSKFTRNEGYLKSLRATGDAELIEGNTWGDTFWGICKGQGENNLGKILMWVRELLS